VLAATSIPREPRVTRLDFLEKERDIQMAEKVLTPDSEDQDSDKDGCDVEIKEFTADEDLPPAEGGIA
jgi:hypothetical protein